MTYLIAQIWLFIAVAAAIGLLFGWMFRGGVSSARFRELRRSLADAQAEAADQRREAAELAARAERRSSMAISPDAAQLQGELRAARERITRLESEAREASRTADRFAEEAEELRHRMADLMSRSGGPGADERAAWRARMSELEAEAESLRRRLDQRDSEATEALETKIGFLEAESESLRQRVAELQAGDDGGASPARVSELESEVEELRRLLAERPDPAEQDARVGALESERASLQHRLDALAQEIGDPLRARIAELESELEATRSSASQSDRATRAEAASQIAALRAEADRLREELARRDAEARELDAMRARIGELETDLDLSRTRAAEAEERVRTTRGDEDGCGDMVVANGGDELQVESARLKWRNSYLTSRIHFLETQLREEEERRVTDADEAPELAAAREEAARLSARVAELEKVAAAHDRSDQPAPNVEGGGGSLEWRNRYLASRVRYLEQRLEERNASGQALGDDEVRLKLAQAQEDLKEVPKLRARVLELERAAEHFAGDEEADGRSDGDRALEWRIRYLSSRVKYLEDRLSKAGVPTEGPESD